MNKILLIMTLILAISCDDKENEDLNEDFNEDMDEEIFQVEMIKENFVGDWSFQKWESIWNGDYILKERYDTLRFNDNGSIRWYGYLVRSFGELEPLGTSNGTWSFNSGDSTFQATFTSRWGSRSTSGKISGKVKVFNSKYLELVHDTVFSEDNYRSEYYFLTKIETDK